MEIRNWSIFEKLINQGVVKLNSINHQTGKYAIHYAAETGNDEAIKMLLDNGADANKQDANDDTALHILLQRWELERENFENCLNLLLNWPNIALNVSNSQGYTPIHLAAIMFDGPAQSILQKAGRKLDLDTFRCTVHNETSREALLKNYPTLENNLPGEWIPDATNPAHYRYRLFYYLKNTRGFGFFKLLREAMENQHQDLLICTDGQLFTYLHRACAMGCLKSVKTLINFGADVNFTLNGIDPPIIVAAKNGHPIIFSILLEKIDLKANDGQTLMHSLIKICGKTAETIECISLLLTHPNFDVNKADSTGRTALHLAAKISHEEAIALLLDKGAKLDIPNSTGDTPMDYMSLTSLRNYLDSKVTSNHLPHNEDEFYYRLNYAFASQSLDSDSYILSTQILSKIANSHELKTLLAHPIYSTAIFLKWLRIRPLFYFYLLLYSLFCLITTAFIFTGIDQKFNCTIIHPSNYSSNDSKCYAISNEHSMSFFRHPFIRLIILVCIIGMAISEATQIITNFAQHIRTIENWLQCTIIISTTAIILVDLFESDTFTTELSAITMLSIWLELFFVIGDHPQLTFFIDIFRRVSFFLLKFLLVHTALILGFAFTFHILFRNNNESFSTVFESLFKTIIMLTGEFDIGDIPLSSCNPVVSHIIFVVFVYMVAIVLFNLLIGFAVSASKTIEDNPFLHRCISQVTIISNYENLYFSPKTSLFLTKPFHYLRRCFRSRDCPRSSTLYLYPNQKNEIKFIGGANNSDDNNYLILPGKLSQTIVDDIQNIIANKQEVVSRKIDKIDELRLQVNEENKIMKNTLAEIMKLLKTENESVELTQNSTGRRKLRNNLN